MKAKKIAKRPLTRRHQHAAEPAAFEATLNDIKALAASINDLHQQMVLTYTPIVQGIIQCGSKDVQVIERTLDHLFTCAGHQQGLLLFKALCRYYYGIDPAAAAQHVHFYREWHEDQESEVGAKVPSSQVAESTKLEQAVNAKLGGWVMAGEWKNYRIDQLGSVITGRTPPGTLPVYFGDRIPFVTPTDMDGRRTVRETVRSLSVQGSEILKRVIVQRGVAVSCIGWQMGKAVLIDRPAATNQQINTLVPKRELADDLFVYYALTSERDAIFRLGAGGSRTPILNKSGFEAFEITLPPLAEQKAIAEVLGALDDKIELKRRMNATLEAMARALFQSWFVDFDPVRAKLDGRQPIGLDPATAALFPSTFQDSEVGHIPKGWTIKPVGEVVDCVGGGTPSTAEPKYWESGTHHWTTPKDFSSLQAPVLLDTDRKLTDAGIAKISSGLLPAGTLLLSSRAPVGYLAITAIPVAINQGFIAMKCNERASNFFMLNWCQTNMAEIESRATGTTFAEISKQNFRPIRVVLPPNELMAAFTAKVAPLYAQITANLHQSRNLAALRDTLLPKLLSGELNVNRASRLTA